MRVAFHAPLKAPDHPVPSGDRTMARALVKALGLAGYPVEQPSRLRTFLPEPDRVREVAIETVASSEVDRIAADWRGHGPPDVWFTYHNYYKAPDLLGPALTRRFGLPYIVAEASHAPKRAARWPRWSALADAASQAADLHLCLTGRDREGIAKVAKAQSLLLDLPPFIDLDAMAPVPRRHGGAVPQLVTVAMMRPGDKLASYRFLAEALDLLADTTWHLTVVGDGPARTEVEEAFARLPAHRLTWDGERDRAGVGLALAAADLFVWPGFGEAFGLGYLEAQASGLPVVALNTAGVANAVLDEKTGVLVPTASPERYAGALRALMADPARRRTLGAGASRFVRTERSLAVAAATLRRHIRLGIPLGSPVDA